MDRLKVLLIDDEQDFLEIMDAKIQKWGYDVIKAIDGKEGIDALKSKNPDIIILDYMMPEMNGVETLKEIRKINKKIPVIMFTSYPDEKSIEGTERLGVSSYIPKSSPYSNTQTSLKVAIEVAAKRLGERSEL